MNENIITAAAIAAANIQVSGNAIVRTASDIGSCFSIINAADKSTIIYIVTEKIYATINRIAHDAEQLSQTAMETCMLASELQDINKKAKGLLSDAKNVNERLVTTVDEIIEFEKLVVNAKANNPLISDDLITMVHAAAMSVYYAKSLTAISLASTKKMVAACDPNSPI